MTRPFRLRDIVLLHQLGGEMIMLDMPQAMIRPHSPIWLSATAALFHGTSSKMTFVTESSKRAEQGFAQLVADRNAAEWRFIGIAPASTDLGSETTIWKTLIYDVCCIAGHQSVLRLFARVDDGSQLGKSFASLGFDAYAQEEIWRVTPSAFYPANAMAQVRPLSFRDSLGLHQLYRQVTPSPVQMAEGQVVAGDSGVRSWIAESMYVWEQANRINGYIGLSSGTQGHVLHLVVHPNCQDAEPLLARGLEMIGWLTDRPVYVVRRNYASGIRPLLEAHGSELIGQQALMVKNLAIRVKEPALNMGTVYEQRIEAAPTHTFDA